MTSIADFNTDQNNIPNFNQDSNPDFNYKSLNRKDLMSLSTIKNDDFKIKNFKKIDTNREWSTNLYNLDIEGSVPKKFGVLHKKIDFINKIDDIERSNPKILHFPLNKPEHSLNCKDIFRAYPQCNTLFITKRTVNPLEPKYQLSKVESIDPPVPKFIRDNINVDGIEGAKPKKYFQWETRKMFDNSGIEGCSPKKSYVRNTKFNNIDYSDVTHDKFKTKRNVNPLDPVYNVDYGNGQNFIHGKIEGSKPVTFNPYHYNNPFNLKTDDIYGCKIGSKNHFNKFKGNDFNLVIKDIRGASADSLKKGIVTKRQTNPLSPIYYEVEQSYQPFGDEIKINTKDKLSSPIEKTTSNFSSTEINYKQEK